MLLSALKKKDLLAKVTLGVKFWGGVAMQLLFCFWSGC